MVGLHQIREYSFKVALIAMFVTANCNVSIKTDGDSPYINKSERRRLRVLRHDMADKKLSRTKRTTWTNPLEYCNTWTSWINDNHPSTTDQSDKESVDWVILDRVCNALYAGEITDVECKDEGNTKYIGSSSYTSYDINCGNERNVSVSCIARSGGKCPDMALRFYCYCDPVLSGVPVQTPQTKATSFVSSTSSSPMISTVMKGPTPESTRAVKTTLETPSIESSTKNVFFTNGLSTKGVLAVTSIPSSQGTVSLPPSRSGTSLTSTNWTTLLASVKINSVTSKTPHTSSLAASTPYTAMKIAFSKLHPTYKSSAAFISTISTQQGHQKDPHKTSTKVRFPWWLLVWYIAGILFMGYLVLCARVCKEQRDLRRMNLSVGDRPMEHIMSRD